MFSNLVRIEVIRLFKSTILKISAAIAMFLLLFIMLVFPYVAKGIVAFYEKRIIK